MILLKIAIIIICGTLNWAGGWHYLFTRRIVMPLLLALYIAIKYHTWWLFVACGMPMAGILSLGYGEKSPLGKVFGGWIARGIWCAFVAVSLSCALVLGHFIAWWLILPYILLNWLIGSIMVKNKANQSWQDAVEGIGFASLVLLL